MARPQIDELIWIYAFEFHALRAAGSSINGFSGLPSIPDGTATPAPSMSVGVKSISDTTSFTTTERSKPGPATMNGTRRLDSCGDRLYSPSRVRNVQPWSEKK